MKQIIAALFILSLFCSCQLGNRKSKMEEYDEQIERQRQEMLQMKKDYNAEYILDSLDFNLTIQFEDVIKKRSKILIRYSDLKDIYKQDSSYYASISTGEPSCHFKLKITKEQKDYFLSMNRNYSYSNLRNAYLIIRLDSIKKLDLSYVSYEDLKIEVGETDSFTAKGTLIELLTKQQ
jgi:hypothetical protein